jgi:hypothetical protein
MPQPTQALDLQQLAAARLQQQANKGNAVMNIALQMFLQGKAESVSGSFVLAEQFINEFERRYGNETQSKSGN